MEIGKLSKDIRTQMKKDRKSYRLKIFEKHIVKTGGIKKAVKFMTDKTNWIPKMKDRTDTTKTKRYDILNIATKFYEDLYSKKIKTDETDLQSNETVPPILKGEIIKAIETQKIDTAPGPDSISNALLMECKSVLAPILQYIFNDILDTETIPTQWANSSITLLHKKGDKNEINNYRPISLMSNIYKVFAKIILRRITRNLDENQPREQAGFRAGYSTLDHIHAGDPISPKLFTAVLEEIFRKLDWDQYGLNIHGQHLNNLRFADDIVIFAESSTHLRSMLEDLERESRKVGLTMNITKTKIMTNATESPIILNSKPIEYVKEYTYLGQQISINNVMSKEIDTRIGLAWKSHWRLKEIMKNEETNVYIKKKLFNTCVLPVLTYGCQTWSLTKAQTSKIRTCQTSMERSMLNIRKKDRVRNKTIRKRTKVEDVICKTRKLKWEWTGHILRGCEKWNRTLIFWYPKNGKRKRGRQIRRWEDEIVATAGKTWTRTALNRKEWKGMEEAFAKLGQTDQSADVDSSES
ncbi:uncharacterized protein LOC123691006 [Colias croceus]|uniref:uncharacterized protein LOC123691006 n=1 Tax=Colias crocea TaxID=72248 RepID=UPI001E27A097|nr:uncharacterized protein LOC123691006 [Colias croceus]